MANFEIQDSSLTGLSGKVVFITGGSSGIGLATAHTFLALNARVIVGDLNPPAEPIANIKYVSCDITNWNSLCSAVQETVSEYGRLDVFVANAGVGEVEDFFSEEIDPATGMLKAPKHTVVEVNLKGTMNCAKIAVSQMRKQETGGSIVFTASTAAYLDERCIPAYTAAKHGVSSLLHRGRKLMLTYMMLNRSWD
jgi:NAD(P)-dependent dehydrogenase (short-subunit alcohol dehydrogenase family)